MTEDQYLSRCNDWLGGIDALSQTVMLDKWHTIYGTSGLGLTWAMLRPIIERYHPHVLEGL